jgi:hypothetical protein
VLARTPCRLYRRCASATARWWTSRRERPVRRATAAAASPDRRAGGERRAEVVVEGVDPDRSLRGRATRDEHRHLAAHALGMREEVVQPRRIPIL